MNNTNRKPTRTCVQVFDANGIKVLSKYFKKSERKNHRKAWQIIQKSELAGLTVKLSEV